jgi:hypothetical protein
VQVAERVARRLTSDITKRRFLLLSERRRRAGRGAAGYNRRAGVVGAQVIIARHRNLALLVAGCYFMEMLDGTNIMV